MLLIKSKKGESFGFVLNIILLTIAISIFAFMSENEKVTGFATAISKSEDNNAQHNLLEFNNIESLGSLAPGNYYIDDYGIVYSIESNPSTAVAKVHFINEIQKNRNIYIDKQGRIGYIIQLER